MSKIERNKGYFYEKDGVKISLSDSPHTIQQVKRKKKQKKIIGWTVGAAIFAVFAVNILILPFTTSLPRVENMSSYSGNNPSICFDEGVMLSAHRAGGDLAPEETLQAFELCMTSKNYVVDIVEFDLHITKDNQLVLLHDDTLDRTSNSAQHFGEKDVKVIDKTYDELRQLNMGENFKKLDGTFPYRGLRGDQISDDIKILGLNEILTYLASMRGEDLHYIIEIKDGGSDGERAMDILNSTLLKFGIEDRTVVGTFKNNVTKYIDDKYPNLHRSASILEVLDFFYAFLYNVDLNKKGLKFDVLQIPYDQFV
ncbi:MAG: glycerophosphodiester phosphodiesterase family protein, partial [Clostridia bacterium]